MGCAESSQQFQNKQLVSKQNSKGQQAYQIRPEESDNHINQQLDQKQKVAVRALQQGFSLVNQPVPNKIKKLYIQNCKKPTFVDQQFSQSLSSIKGEPKVLEDIKQNLTWKRALQLQQDGQPLQLFYKIQPTDVVKGKLSNSALMASLCSLARDPKNIQNLFAFADVSIGFYVVKLYIDGIASFIVVDDYLPYDKSSNQLIFSKIIQCQTWVVIMEKAWAKMMGSYLHNTQITPQRVLQSLTGASCQLIRIQNEKSMEQKNEILGKIQKHNSLKHQIVLLFNSKKEYYSLLKINKIKNKYILKVRNPERLFEWKGEYKEGSNTITSQITKVLGFPSTQEGIFFVSSQQFFNLFSVCYVSLCPKQQ